MAATQNAKQIFDRMVLFIWAAFSRCRRRWLFSRGRGCFLASGGRLLSGHSCVLLGGSGSRLLARRCTMLLDSSGILLRSGSGPLCWFRVSALPEIAVDIKTLYLLGRLGSGFLRRSMLRAS